MVDIIIPTLNKPHLHTALSTLKYLPFEYNLHLINDGTTWAQAVNIGIAKSKNDIILMDDDVQLTKDTFKDFDKYYAHADIFGFKLLFPDKTIQHAGGYYKDGSIGHYCFKMVDCDVPPMYVQHVTASLMYIKQETVQELLPFCDWPDGQQFEDMDFCFRSLKHGKKILLIPNAAWHIESGTKKDAGDFDKKLEVNKQRLISAHISNSFIKILEGLPIEFQPV